MVYKRGKLQVRKLDEKKGWKGRGVFGGFIKVSKGRGEGGGNDKRWGDMMKERKWKDGSRKRLKGNIVVCGSRLDAQGI